MTVSQKLFQQSQMDLTSNYKPEVDGLRAVAVVLVLLYHVGYAALPGGFIGVDVFFVISGYLITRLLVLQISNGTFSFGRFYGRRVRRLAPALIATVALTLVAAAFVYSTTDMTRLAIEVYPALLGFSNFRYSISSGYFEAAANNFTFLNTWSLAVEEQYYLFAPLIIYIIYRWFSFRGLIVATIVAGSLSFLAYLIAHRLEPTVAFYWPFYRIWEFSLGGALVFLQLRQWLSLWIQEVAAFLGLLLIAASAVFITSEDGGAGALLVLPCLGAVLIISCSENTFIGRILSSRPFVSVGLISYSLYLVHWPIIMIFMRFRTGYEILEQDRIPAILLSFIVAIFIYFTVEKRFRAGPQNRLSFGQFSLSISGIIAVIFLVSFSIYKGEGWPWRIYSQYEAASEGYGSCRDVTNCVLSDEGPGGIIVAGDSHAKHLAEGLAIAAKGRSAKILAASACYINNDFKPEPKRIESCKNLHNIYESALSSDLEATIIYAQRWRGYGSSEDVANSIRNIIIKNKNHKIIIVGQIHETDDEQFFCGVVSSYIYESDRCLSLISTDVGDSYNAAIQKVVDDFENATLVNPNISFCPNGECRAVIGKEPLYIDTNHISAFASRRIFTQQIIPLLNQ